MLFSLQENILPTVSDWLKISVKNSVAVVLAAFNKIYICNRKTADSD